MQENILEVENLSKMYRLGSLNTGSIAHDFNRWMSRIAGKEDPYEKIAETNDRTLAAKSGYVWSLQDINFSVQKGEVFGIVGNNGAGKSTLLKILSKITRPTKGTIKLDGRISSLLEVGTGFHPDLNGRENIYLNGAILGMKKQEIRNRYDEIIEFSGVERYIETPVKRYSSGMLVRLAFAVAAHLEPDILIIDEVLAVGDIEFQKKCLGKMEQVSMSEGRTVIFVSHNLAAVRALCSRGLLLDKGKVKISGNITEVLDMYEDGYTDIENGKRNIKPQQSAGYFTEWWLANNATAIPYSCFAGENFEIIFSFVTENTLDNCDFHILLKNSEGLPLLHISTQAKTEKKFQLQSGNSNLKIGLQLPLRHGKYEIEAALFSSGNLIDHWKTSTKLAVLDAPGNLYYSTQPAEGILNIKTDFELENNTKVISDLSDFRLLQTR